MKFAILGFSLACFTSASNPCERLCIIDGSAVCTGGSWPKGDNICHAYFLLPSGEHCYHNAATSQVCHDRLPPLTIGQAAFFVAALTPESTTSTTTTTTRPTTSTTTTTPTTTTTTSTTTTSSTTTSSTTSTQSVEPVIQRRRVIPIAAVPTTSTTTTTTTTTTSQAPVVERRRRVIPIGVVPEQPTTSTTTVGPSSTTVASLPERVRRVFPVGGNHNPDVPRPVARNLMGEFDSPASPAPMVRGVAIPAPIVGGVGFLPPTPPPIGSGGSPALDDLVNGDGPNSIGQAAAAAVGGTGNWDNVARIIGQRFSGGPAISGDDFIFVWERSGGELLMATARREGAESCRTANRVRNACFCLVLLVSEMPLPADTQARTDALELIGFSQFATDHEEALVGLLTATTRDFSLENPSLQYGENAQTKSVLFGFAANWIERIPNVITNPSRRAIVLRHRLFRYMMMNDVSAGRYYHGLRFDVARAQAFAESYETLAQRAPAELRRGVAGVAFRGEGAIGQGVVREWYSQISQDVYSSNFALFEYRAEAPGYYRISQYSDHHPRNCFVAIGRFMAMSIVQGIPIGVNMHPMFYKRLMEEALTVADVETNDPDTYRAIQTVMEYTTDEELEAIGAPMPHAFPEHVQDVAELTLANRDTQLAAALDNISVNHMEEQFDWFRQGFFAVLPRELFAGISAADLDRILFGDQVIDIDDLAANVNFEGYSMASAPVQYLFTVLRELTQEQRRQFLKFGTSNTQLPLGGFGSLNPRFRITRIHSDPDHLPGAHTCFNTIDLPQYVSLEQTREKILLAITHGNTGMLNL